MNYELIENLTTGDIAVRVKAPSKSLLFRHGAEALMSELVDDIATISASDSKIGVLEGDDLTLLYFEFLNEFLFYKDSENLLLVPSEVTVTASGKVFTCRYILKGEKIDRSIHKFRVDIKAVTLHAMRIYKDDGFFFAESVFDV